jgi:citrate synthase
MGEPGKNSAPDQAQILGDDALEVEDLAQRQRYRIAIDRGAIRATEIGHIRADEYGYGLVSYDPALFNTAVCRSAITFIDGERGILRYRGYPIQDLAGKVGFLDVAYLLAHGELPDIEQSRGWTARVAEGSQLPEGISALVQSFPPDAHPMAVLMAATAALGAYHPEAKHVEDREERLADVPRFIGALAATAGLVYRHRVGRPMALPASKDGFAATVLAYLSEDGASVAPDPAIEQAIDMLLVLQADHEQNCSTNAVRVVGSSRVDPYSAFTAGVAALYGPLHGGANEAVVRMLHEIGSPGEVPAFIARVKGGERRLMGFGHRVYKSYDPRAAIIKETAEAVFAVTAVNPLLEVALAIESIALSDDYFVSRHLYPNVDFYSGLIYEALGLPMDFYTVLFAVARIAGWAAQWYESVGDAEQKITRPRQLYIGPGLRPLESGLATGSE